MFSRVESLIGKDALIKLQNSSVAIFGIGGVGGYAVEALVRSGVGSVAIFDGDCVDKSNLNRQIFADNLSVGKQKVLVAKDRLLSINPNLKITTHNLFVTEENINILDFSEYSYVIDAIDTVKSKIAIIKKAKLSNVPIISCMGTGGKLDLTKLKVDDISKTNGCPLARVVRKQLKDQNITKVKVVYSPETVQGNSDIGIKGDGKKAPASMIFVPATAGLLLAKSVVLDLIK